MVEFACGIPSLFMGQALANIARQVDCETIRHPAGGVCVGITPFNFQVMVPLWMFPVAITCRKYVRAQALEKVPLSAVRLGELLIESGLPEGVFSIVHGDAECAGALLSHPLARRCLVRRLDRRRSVRSMKSARVTVSGCRLPAAPRNHLIIMPDADLEPGRQRRSSSRHSVAPGRALAWPVASPCPWGTSRNPWSKNSARAHRQ